MIEACARTMGTETTSRQLTNDLGRSRCRLETVGLLLHTEKETGTTHTDNRTKPADTRTILTQIYIGHYNIYVLSVMS